MSEGRAERTKHASRVGKRMVEERSVGKADRKSRSEKSEWSVEVVGASDLINNLRRKRTESAESAGSVGIRVECPAFLFTHHLPVGAVD